MEVTVTCTRQRGFWRLGRFWPKSPVLMELSVEDVAVLQAEKLLKVEIMEPPTNALDIVKGLHNVKIPARPKKKSPKKTAKKVATMSDPSPEPPRQPTDEELAAQGKYRIKPPPFDTEEYSEEI